MATAPPEAVRLVGLRARPLRDTPSDHDALLDLVGDARVVLLGEATHGTHEFYAERARITQRLVAERGFSFVAAEADWPDAWRVDRYARGLGRDADAVEALAGFRRFPAWMWRNADVLDFVGWLRSWNEHLPRSAPRVGFYGLDLYSLHDSIAAVLAYLDHADPAAAKRARDAYACLHQFGEDPQRYGRAAALGLGKDCEEEVVQQLLALQRRREQLLQRDGRAAEDDFFSAEQNARLVADAEGYYRSMFRGRVSSWNLRDTHMADTLDALLEHVTRVSGRPAKAIVWAHNSHVGDARHTEVGRLGELNVGQLARERHPGETCNIGFTTSLGTVTAASSWGGPAERKRVRPPLAGSYEALFHQVARPRWFLDLHDEPVREALLPERLERAIGVVYLPETERQSHYFQVRLPDQFDAVFHFDETRAVEPLERTSAWPTAELPETFPEGV